jgi:excinuclease ABC subunit A
MAKHVSHKYISVRGAREHNLKNVNVDIPRDELVVITGLSGSGKSSLAFDTIYAEGQRRYVESLSSYARQFLEQMQKPDVDVIEGLSPAISIEQKTTSRNPRSTVGTVTEIYDYLRLLFARIGVPYSPATGLPIESQTVSQMVDKILAFPVGTRIYILAPIARGKKGEFKRELFDLQKKGFTRVRVNTTLYDIEDVPALDKKLKHNIEVVVDRLEVGEDLGNRLPDSLETALHLSDGLVYVQEADTDTSYTFSAKFCCPVSGFTVEEIEPRLFSFNSPFGACPSCDGLGSKLDIDPDLIVPDESLSIAAGAIAPWSYTSAKYYQQSLHGVLAHFKESPSTPFKDLAEKTRKAILYGTGNTPITMAFEDDTRSFKTQKPFEGVIPNLSRRFRETESGWAREEISRYQSSIPCETCHGYRLKAEALSIKVNGSHISEVSNLAIKEAQLWFQNLPQGLSSKHNDIAVRVIKEIQERLTFLVNVGLEYLTLSRSATTLSGGESQRIRLASQIGSGLTGVLYVLDEPSIGLHSRDNRKLLDTLLRLKALGNTVLVVEHDEEAMHVADLVIDIGPGAGIHGGHVVAQGTAKEIMENPNSLTGQYLKGTRKIEIPKERRKPDMRRAIEIVGASANNLQNVSCKIPLGVMTTVTGVSGSGKSTLILETLYKALMKKLHNTKTHPGAHETIRGLEFLDKVIDIDQSPIGRTPRSNPATYTGTFTPIRDWFASLPEAKARGYSAGRFSFNVKGGRCEACQGDGVLKIEMHFLPDVYVECEICHGKRYNRETLEITYKDKSIADVLNMTVEEAVHFFEPIPMIHDKLATLEKVGLGYIKVGQQATTLSGGEAQRIKLAKELAKRSTGRTLYILDEPTTGLHFEDVRKLLEVLQTLVNQGNTILIIEHNMDVIKVSDWLIDLGPEGGTGGGYILVEGTPETVAQAKESYTGHFLKNYLKV